MTAVVKRDENGRFLPGTTGGPGRPRKANELRAAMLEAVTEDDIIEVTGQLLAAAKRGEPWAVRELLDRATGKPQTSLAVDADDDGSGQVLRIIYTVDHGPNAGDDENRELIDADGFEVFDGD